MEVDGDLLNEGGLIYKYELHFEVIFLMIK